MASEGETVSPLELLAWARKSLLTRAAMAACYADSWGADFASKEVRECWLKADEAQRVTVAQLMEIPDETLRDLGFGSWDGALTLFPLWAWPLLADGEELSSISGRVGRKGAKRPDGRDEIDLDTRFGCIAYGFTKPGARPDPDLAEA